MELIMISRMRRQASPHRKIRGFTHTYNNMLSTDQNPITLNRRRWSVFYESTKEEFKVTNAVLLAVASVDFL